MESFPGDEIANKEFGAGRDAERKSVCAGSRYSGSSWGGKSTREEINLVSKFRGGIGAVSSSFIKKNPGKGKVIQSQPITRPLSFITKGAPDPIVQKVIDFLKSDAIKPFYQ